MSSIRYSGLDDPRRLRTAMASSVSPPSSALSARDIELWRGAVSAFARGFQLNADGTVNTDASVENLREWLGGDGNTAFFDLIGRLERLSAADRETLTREIRTIYAGLPGVDTSSPEALQAVQRFTRLFVGQSELEMMRHELNSLSFDAMDLGPRVLAAPEGSSPSVALRWRQLQRDLRLLDHSFTDVATFQQAYLRSIGITDANILGNEAGRTQAFNENFERLRSGDEAATPRHRWQPEPAPLLMQPLLS